MSETLFPEGPIGTFVAAQLGGGTPSRQNPGYWNGPIPWASVKDFDEGQIELTETDEYITQQGLTSSATNVIPANTPIVCTRMAVGRVAVAPMDVAINQDLKGLFPTTSTDTRYLLRLADYAKPRAEAVSVGSTVKGIKVADYLNIQVPLAPPSHQSKIAEILDTLDAAIRGTEAVVAKLKAMKQGLLHDLLTRGIDGNGELRLPQSEAPHLYKQTPLGWLPTEWGTSTVGEIIAEPTRNGLYKPASHHGRGPLMVQMGCLFSDEAVNFSGATRVSVAPIELNQFGLQNGDLLFARRSLVFEGAGLCSIVRDLPEPSTFESSIIRLRLRSTLILPEFAGLFFRGHASSQQRRKLIRQVAVSGVSSADVKSLYVALPSIDEQCEIIQRYVAINEKIDKEVFLLDKLRLQKSGLMDDLLTGRKPVTALL